MRLFSLLMFIFAVKVSVAAEIPLPLQVSKLQTIAHYIHDGTAEYPTYSGALGFGYPSQSGKSAISAHGVDYYTFSNCVVNSNGSRYMIVSVADSVGNKFVIRRINGQCDPHENAAIYADADGYITVAQSSRGDWRKGFIFKSVQPYDITQFKQIASGYYAYPKITEKGIVYTRYYGSTRKTRFRSNDGSDVMLVDAGGYSTVTEGGDGSIHVLYDFHINGDLTRRVNLYYMWSPDGVSWFNENGEKLTLPVSPNSVQTRITDDQRYIFSYIKDFKFINGELQALVVRSTSNIPNRGHRDLYVYHMDGSSTLITPVGHSYDASNFWRDGIITAISNEYPYAGGYLHFFSMNGVHLGTWRGLGDANFPIAVGDRLYFGDTSKSSVNKGDAGLYKAILVP